MGSATVRRSAIRATSPPRSRPLPCRAAGLANGRYDPVHDRGQFGAARTDPGDVRPDRRGLRRHERGDLGTAGAALATARRPRGGPGARHARTRRRLRNGQGRGQPAPGRLARWHGGGSGCLDPDGRTCPGNGRPPGTDVRGRRRAAPARRGRDVRRRHDRLRDAQPGRLPARLRGDAPSRETGWAGGLFRSPAPAVGTAG